MDALIGCTILRAVSGILRFCIGTGPKWAGTDGPSRHVRVGGSGSPIRGGPGLEREPRLSCQAKTGPVPEQGAASGTSRTERELTRPVRGGSVLETDPKGPDSPNRLNVTTCPKVLNLRNAPERTLLNERLDLRLGVNLSSVIGNDKGSPRVLLTHAQAGPVPYATDLGLTWTRD